VITAGIRNSSGIPDLPKGIPVSVPAILDRKFLFLQEFPRNFHKIK
jgi:hypothetical protein